MLNGLEIWLRLANFIARSMPQGFRGYFFRVNTGPKGG